MRRRRLGRDGQIRRDARRLTLLFLLASLVALPVPAHARSAKAVFQEIVDASVEIIGQRLGHPLRFRPEVVINKKQVNLDGLTLAYADPKPTKDAPDVVTRCGLHVNPAALERVPDDQAYVVIHEVVHCFQADLLGMEGMARCPAWLCEGSAFWAGKRVAEALGYDITSAQGGAWQTYLTKPGTNLFSRSYDAIGFYGHLEQAGIDPWTVLEAMWQAGDDQRAFGLAIATGRDGFIDSWASSQLRLPALGGAWIADGPGIPDAAVHATPTEVSVGSRSQQSLDAPSMTNGLYKVTIDADVLTVSTTGSVRLTDESGHDIVGPNGAFCANGTTCECPPGTSYEGPPVTDIDTTAYLALTGAEGGAKAELSGTTMEDLCVFTECPVSLSEASVIAGMPMVAYYPDLADALGNDQLRVYRGARVPGGALDIIEYICGYDSFARTATDVERKIWVWFTAGEPASYLWDLNLGSISKLGTLRTGPSPFPGQVYEYTDRFPADGVVHTLPLWETVLEVRGADSFFHIIVSASGASASADTTKKMANAVATAITELLSSR